jgi:DNA primase
VTSLNKGSLSTPLKDMSMIDMDLVGVIENEGIELIDRGSNYACVCPFHEDNAPSLVVYKTSLERFYCFGCHVHGDAIDFIQWFKDYTFKQAVIYLDADHVLKNIIKRGERIIDLIAREEREGIDVQNRYGKKLIDTLLAKELICPK